MGDEMNLRLLVDDYEIESFSVLAPHYGVLDLNTPFKVSSNIAIPGPVMQTIANYIHEGE